MIKLIIFDLDGTLLNTVEDLGRATNFALIQCGFPEREIEEYKFLCGRGIYNLFRNAMPKNKINNENINKIKNLFLDYYNKHQTDYTKPYEGIIPMLDELKSKEIEIAIATNKYQEGAESLVKKYFGKYNFIKILGQRDKKPIKPDPEIINEILLEKPSIPKEEVLYCGDSDVDMQTGINSGLKTIGVTWGFRTREELETYNPCLIADTPKEIINNLLTL